tara:strand:- start:7114 stop:7965 length:852 start_codon:yes stop_codon:yes gene_type:complete
MLLKHRKIFLIVSLFFISLCAFSQNKTDENKNKQGHWVFTNKTKNLPGYKSDQIVEEGNYENNRKVGIWTFYFNNRKVKHKLNYINNKPNGAAIFYYKNGKIREKGTWKNNRWIGLYEMYYPNGNLKNKFNYNNQGQKNGAQFFFHENGNLMISGTWNNGNASDDLHEYNENGIANTERYKAGPPISIGSDTVNELDPTSDTVSNKVVVIKKKKTNTDISLFEGNGYQEFKDRKGRNIRVGTFKNGYLFEGKTFEYDKKGKISITQIIKNGKITKIIDHSTLK